MKSVYIETYGCSANQAHSETMEGLLVSNGFRVTENPGKADMILINTCIVKTPTEDKIRDRIKYLVREYPGKKMIIAGCASDVGMFGKIAPNAEFLSSHRSKDVVRLIKQEAKDSKRKKRINPVVGITEIASGCLGRCSYCIVKLARGDLKSRKTGDIVKEVERSVSEGCREIWLTSQDCGCYGKDIGTDIAELVKNVAGIDGDFRIRVGMMNPEHLKPVLNRMVEVYRNPKVYKFAHIPVQSGSDRILRLMKRGYKVKDFERIVEEFRKHVPGLMLSTDVIVGFPGETEKDFTKTMQMIEKVRPDIVNVSKFGARPGTEAARIEQIDPNIVKETAKKVSGIAKRITMERNREWKGRECVILVTERGKKKNQFMGRNGSYKPVVLESEKNLMGKFLKVRIANVGMAHLEGEIIRNSV